MSIGKEIGRKLSVADLGFDKGTILETVLANRAEKHFLARFVGVVSSLKPYKIKEGERAGDTAFGLMGQFQGTAANGETKEGSVLYLPGYVNDMIVAIFQTSDDIASVKIAFDVYAAYDADAATSYVFTVNDLLNQGSEGVAEVNEAIKALPLPSEVKALPKK